MKIWDKVKRIFAAGAALASTGGTVVSQLPPNVPQTTQLTEDQTAIVSNRPGNCSEDPPPYQAVMSRLSGEIKRPPTVYTGLNDDMVWAPPPRTEIGLSYGLDELAINNTAYEYRPSPYQVTFDTFSSYHPENQINYAKLHSQNTTTLAERIWEIYDTYFDGEEIPESDFRSEREKFILEIFGWFAKFSVSSIASGILGNLTYDELKERIERRKEKSTDNIGKYYKKLGEDLDLILDILAKIEKEGRPIRVHEISLATGISKEIIRSWLKSFGFTHHSNCNWEPVRRNNYRTNLTIK